MPETVPDLLASAVDAHGGAERWAAVAELRFRLRVRGNILAFRGRSPRWRTLDVVLDTTRVHARLSPFPRVGAVGVLDGKTVRIEDESGRILSERTDAERQSRRAFFWDDLDELYFFAYSFWNYATTPFLLAWPGVETHELAPLASSVGPLRRLHARFPPTIPTHCPQQTFVFGPDGLLRRLDYTADVFGALARGAHLCERHQTFDGIVIPTYRRVVPRPVGLWTLPGPLAMEGWIDEVEVVRAGETDPVDVL